MKDSEKEESGGRRRERYYKRKKREKAAPVEFQPQRETHQSVGRLRRAAGADLSATIKEKIERRRRQSIFNHRGRHIKV